LKKAGQESVAIRFLCEGEANKNSDVDVLVDIDYVPGIVSDYITWRDELAERLNKKVDIVQNGKTNL